MDLYNLVLSAKLIKGEGGGGGDIDVDPLTVTENGVYSASSGHAYSPVTVSVPQSGITPTGTSNITANGIYDVTNFASASVAVPGASGTTNITSNGIYDIASFASASVNVPGIVPSGTSTITSNGIYDITDFASVDVNVSGGGGGDHDVEDAIVQRTISGTYENSRVTMIGPNAFGYCSLLTSVRFQNATLIGADSFRNCSSLAEAWFDNVSEISGAATFNYCGSLASVYILASSVANLESGAAFNNSPMSKTYYLGYYGSIYVPASLVDSYKAASNWSYWSKRITAYEGE
jgi:hypothetical protein